MQRGFVRGWIREWNIKFVQYKYRDVNGKCVRLEKVVKVSEL